MNLKEAIYREISGIEKFTAQFGANFQNDQVFQDFRPKEYTFLNDEEPPLQVVFFEFYDSGINSKVRNVTKRFEFHFLGKHHQEDNLIIMRDILTDHFLNNFRYGGKINGQFEVTGCYDGEYGERDDLVTGEKILTSKLSFSLIRQQAGNFE